MVILFARLELKFTEPQLLPVKYIAKCQFLTNVEVIVITCTKPFPMLHEHVAHFRFA